MDSTFIAATVQNIWNTWNIRGFMILSLCMQIVLALAAPLRKKTSNAFVTFVVWSAYFLADWAAIFAFGLISNAGNRSTKDEMGVAQNLMAFWAAFLLIHLGGPDTITAFSLEDNALWLRHLVGLIAQVFVFLYIFVKSLTNGGILAPTVLIFVAGVIKYGERTRSLYLASLENLKTSIRKTPNLYDVAIDSEQDEANFPEDIKPAFHFYKIFKGLIVDIVPNISQRDESREFILKKEAHEVFRLISMELDFLYEVFYTKIMAANSGWGVFIRSIAYSGTLAAFILFCLADKDEFHKVDIAITYALFAGVFVLDAASGVMVATSDWTNTSENVYLFLQVVGQGFFPFLVGVAVYSFVRFCFEDSAFVDLMDRVWSEKMGSFNLLSHCFKECAPRKCHKRGLLWEKLAVMRSTSKEAINPELWGLVLKNLERKATDATDAETMRKVYEARGDWAIEESLCHELMPCIKDFEYDNTLLIWHIATEICYNIEGDVGYADDMKKYSKILSDYMMYLLVNRPKLMSAVAGISYVRNEDTCVEVKLLGRKFGASTMQEFCRLILEEHATVTEPAHEVTHCALSVLKDACNLVQLIGGNDERWEIFFKVWMELFSYAAGHCKADSHARLLSEGGEFITFVWMLMAHYGIGAQFPVK